VSDTLHVQYPATTWGTLEAWTAKGFRLQHAEQQVCGQRANYGLTVVDTVKNMIDQLETHGSLDSVAAPCLQTVVLHPKQRALKYAKQLLSMTPLSSHWRKDEQSMD
jgi:hypothetical protein